LVDQLGKNVQKMTAVVFEAEKEVFELLGFQEVGYTMSQRVQDDN
jgi:hypothetical protein